MWVNKLCYISKIMLEEADIYIYNATDNPTTVVYNVNLQAPTSINRLHLFRQILQPVRSTDFHL